MAIAVGATSKGRVTSGVSNSVTSTAVDTQASGSTIVLGLVWDANQNVGTVSDNKGNSYTLIGSEVEGGGAKSRLYYCQNATGGSGHTATHNSGTTNIKSIYFLEVTGALTTGVLDKNAQASDSSSPFSSGTFGTATAQADELLVGFLGGTSASSYGTVVHAIDSASTPTSGWTIHSAAQETDGSNYYTGGLCSQVVSSTGQYNVSWTEKLSGTDSLTGTVHLASFKAASTQSNAPRSVHQLKLMGAM